MTRDSKAKYTDKELGECKLDGFFGEGRITMMVGVPIQPCSHFIDPTKYLSVYTVCSFNKAVWLTQIYNATIS